MYNIRILYYVLLLIAVATSTDSTKCSRIIEGTTGMPRSSAEDKYHFFMTLYNRTDSVTAYMPNTRYSVVLLADSTDQLHRKFTRFLISAEAENANETAEVGVFDPEDDAMTKFADHCANAVVETSKMQKERVSITWTSPVEGSGCILFRATVAETDTWYIDDSNLRFTVCQDSKAEADDQGPVLTDCCACDEAKYEIVFEGLWSRNTHPKDFPSKGWLIRFSDVIGASHTGDYRFWRYNETASVGLRQVAELGATRKLESELKNRSENIRTIIKARGISYPNVTGKTFAVFRVDRKHHLMSLVSMIEPSPDWFVGVSGLELCLPNCSWIEHKELNLYPYDAGTDDGITYMSPDSPTKPQEPIRRITSTYPSDSKSPFYDPFGLDMKPLAKLYLNRQRLYEKTCDDAGDVITDTEACKVMSWGEWTACSATCGKGTQLRQRRFRDEAAASVNKCSTPLTGRRACYNTQSPYCTNYGRHDGLLESEKCELTEWSPWTLCSSSCGEGSKTRSRIFRQKKYRKQCRAVPNGPQLQQSIDCENKPCEGEDAEEVRRLNHLNNDDEDYSNERVAERLGIWEEWMQGCAEDAYTGWSIWSPCSASCGHGIKLRSRELLHKENLDKDDEKCKMQMVPCIAEISSCNFTREEIEQICSEPLQKGNCNGNMLRTYFDKQTGSCQFFMYTGCDGNRNNFPTTQDCYKVCGNLQRELRGNLSTIMKNLKVSLSSVLSYHIPVQEQRSTKAKRAQHEKEKGIHPSIQASSQMESSENGKVDCQVSEWSKWSHCENCRGYAISTREIMILPENGGKSCPRKLLRKKKCHKIPPCSLQGDGTGRRFHRDKNTNPEHDISVDCKVTPWSTWSKCSATCGEGLRSRVRNVMVKPTGPWAKLCPTLVEFKKCRRVNCPQ